MAFWSSHVAHFTHRSVVHGSADDVFRWHERPEALLDLLPSRRWMRIESRTGGVRDGGRVTFSFGAGPLRVFTQVTLPQVAPGLVVAVGHFRNGILLAPATGELVADLVLGRPTSVPAGTFAPGPV